MGLFLDLYLGLNYDLDVFGIEKGVYVSIDPKNSNPYAPLENVIEIPTGKETNILVDTSVFEKYPQPYSSCNFEPSYTTQLNENLADSRFYEQVIYRIFMKEESNFNCL